MKYILCDIILDILISYIEPKNNLNTQP